MFGLDAEYLFQSKHDYSFEVIGLKKVHGRIFRSREAANDYMHILCRKYGLQIVKVWEDNHDKTYICQNGVQFFIQRTR